MEEEAALKAQLPSGFVCPFLASSFEDFEDAVCTTAVVDSAETWICQILMVEAQACLLLGWGRCFQEAVMVSPRGVLEVEVPV